MAVASFSRNVLKNVIQDVDLELGRYGGPTSQITGLEGDSDFFSSLLEAKKLIMCSQFHSECLFEGCVDTAGLKLFKK